MRKARIWLKLVAIFLILGLILPGCSGGGGTSAPGVSSQTPPTQENTAIIPDTTKVFSQAAIQSLSSVSQDGSTLSFSQATPELQNLKVGDVIVLGVGPLTPNGLLRKVTSVQIPSTLEPIRNLGEGRALAKVETVPASLEEAFQNLDLKISKDLTPDDIRSFTPLIEGVSLQVNQKNARQDKLTGNYSLTISQGVELGPLSATGSISFDLKLEVDLKIRNFKAEKFSYLVTMSPKGKLELEARAKKDLFKGEIKLAEIRGNPIPTPIPYLVLIPTETISIGAEGNVSLGIKASVEVSASFTGGMSYSQAGGWVPTADISDTYDYNLGIPHGGEATLQAYLKLGSALMINGGVGPNIDKKAYLELTARSFTDPWWEFYAGFKVSLTLKSTLFSLEYELIDAIHHRFLLARGPKDPSDLAASKTTSGLQLTWRDNTIWETGYEIEKGTDGVTFTKIGVIQKDLSAYTDGQVLPDTTYYYRVRAFSDLLRKKEYSDYSNVAVAKITSAGTLDPAPPPAPGPAPAPAPIPGPAPPPAPGPVLYNDHSPSWSPDGTRIAFLSDRAASFAWDIYVMNADGSNKTRLTSSGNSAHHSWSPDGSKILYNDYSVIYVMNADGSNKTRLAAGSGPSWSPDGSKIAYWMSSVYIMNADGSNKTILPADGTDPLLWSPDGSKIAIKYPGLIYTRDTDPSSPGSFLLISEGYASSWSPDGSKIAFFWSAFGAPYAVYVINANGLYRTRLADGVRPLWSPDGSKIAFFSDYSSNSFLKVMNADGSNQTSLAAAAAGTIVHASSWSPDGSKIAFTSNVLGTYSIYVINVNGSGQTMLSK